MFMLLAPHSRRSGFHAVRFRKRWISGRKQTWRSRSLFPEEPRNEVEIVFVVDDEDEIEIQAGWWIWVPREDLKAALEELGVRALGNAIDMMKDRLASASNEFPKK